MHDNQTEFLSSKHLSFHIFCIMCRLLIAPVVFQAILAFTCSTEKISTVAIIFKYLVLNAAITTCQVKIACQVKPGL